MFSIVDASQEVLDALKAMRLLWVQYALVRIEGSRIIRGFRNVEGYLQCRRGVTTRYVRKHLGVNARVRVFPPAGRAFAIIKSLEAPPFPNSPTTLEEVFHIGVKKRKGRLAPRVVSRHWGTYPITGTKGGDARARAGLDGYSLIRTLDGADYVRSLM